MIPNQTLKTRLPRYRFTPTSAVCAVHGDPTCLCDVSLPTVSTPILFGTNVLFGNTALKAVGAENVSPTNFYAWAEYLLGSYETFIRLPLEQYRDNDDESPPPRTQFSGVSGWMLLGKPLRQHLNQCARDGLKWSEVKHLVTASGLAPDDVRYISRAYNVRAYSRGPKSKRG